MLAEAETHLPVAARFAVGESTAQSRLRRDRLTDITTGRLKLEAAGGQTLRALLVERGYRALRSAIRRCLRWKVGSVAAAFWQTSVPAVPGSV